MAYDLPEDLLKETFLASTGPGGQNVNKVATACQLRVDVFALGLQPYAFRQLKILAGSKMTMNGELIVTARSHRNREANRADARARVIELIDRAHIRQ
ncbi:MAG: aminoacyl-tRNA hydrolase, partial [Sphingorhabdus sp.]|nr:aminoacyl-tRNA hydrolase [Sphingorhabdus sp.]